MDEGRKRDAEGDEGTAKTGKSPIQEENEARVVGRIVNPPKVREGTTTKGAPYKMARFTMAVNRTYKGNRETDFIPVVLWDALAEAVGKAGKGTALRVEGRIKTHEVEGKQYRWELKGEVLEVLDLRPAAQSGAEARQEELLAS